MNVIPKPLGINNPKWVDIKNMQDLFGSIYFKLM